jgi:hypothetical protein
MCQDTIALAASTLGTHTCEAKDPRGNPRGMRGGYL